MSELVSNLECKLCHAISYIESNTKYATVTVVTLQKCAYFIILVELFCFGRFQLAAH